MHLDRRLIILVFGAVLGLSLHGETARTEPSGGDGFSEPLIEAYDGPLEESLPIGESLDYKVFWSFIHVANATVDILPAKRVEGRPAYHIRMKTQTNGWADAFYQVRDRIDSYMTPDLRKTLFYSKIQKGTDKRNTRIIFDWQERLALRTDYGDPWMETIPLEDQVFDPLGITYAFRMLDFEEGERLVLYSTDGKRLVPVDIEVKGVETVRTPLGKFECYKVEPDTKALSGVFKKAPNAKIYIWVSRDPPYVPVRLKSELHIGAFESKLSGIRGPAADQFLEQEVRGKYSTRPGNHGERALASRSVRTGP